MKQVDIHYREVKKVLKKSNVPDSFFASRYSLSPYMSCEHSCLYCDGRAEKYHQSEDFGQNISVRSNIIEVLERELPVLRERAVLLAGSGISDVYQPCEAREKLMPKIINQLIRFKIPLRILTKSCLAERDLGLLSELNSAAGFTMMMSFSTLDDALAGQIEPGASLPSEKLRVLKAFHDAGIKTGVFAMPLLPGLSDSEGQFSALAERVKQAGVSFIIPGPLTLRPGRQKELFLQYIASSHSSLLPLYRQLYSEDRSSGAAVYDYSNSFFHRCHNVLGRTDLPGMIPHSIYRSSMGIADQTWILMDHLKYLYNSRSSDLKRLSSSLKLFEIWLKKERSTFNRRKSLPPGYVDTRWRDILHGKKAAEILENGKLAAFLEPLADNNQCFNYQKRLWESL